MSDAVPYLDLARQNAALREEILAAWAPLVDRAAFVGGAPVAELERGWAEACRTRHAIGVASGTDAIKLALAAAGVAPGDEVVVPAFTFVATAGAVREVGATPVLADVRDSTPLICPESAAAVVGERTRAVVVVHLYGIPCDPEPVRQAVARARPGGPPVAVVEDCAQAHGATLAGRPVGSLAQAGAFSFYPTKNLGALGDGGAVTTDDDALADRVRMLADHGRPTDPARRDQHLVAGVNSRLDALQAAALSVKLRHLPAWNRRRAEVAAAYSEVLSGRDDVALPEVPADAAVSWYVYALRHGRRADLQAALGRRGVTARPVYPRALHESPAWADRARPGRLESAEAWGREVLTLPMFAEITDSEVERVLAALPAALDEVAG